jgi:hypothetical protein
MGLSVVLISRADRAKYPVQSEKQMRQEFNWSQLDRANLYTMLYQAGTDIVGRKMPVKTLHKRLSTHIKSCLPVSIKKWQYDAKQDRGFPYIGGTYDSVLDKKGHTRFVEVVLSYHPDDQEVRITNYRWVRICSLFADTILHEMIHMRQYRSRNFKDIPGYESTAHYHRQRQDQEYYGHRDEMGAFAFNIACEMLDRFGYDPVNIRSYMDTVSSRTRKGTFTKFLAAFEWNHDHVKVRQMKQKVMKQLEYAAIGRPFKTTTHLTY